jgi:hypothetical protein
VLEGSGSELEREFGFGVARQLFEPVLGAELSPAALGLTDDAGAGPDARFALIHGLYWLTANLAAEQPLLLWVDDLGWVDEPTLRLLGYLGRRLDGLPALVLVALRPALAGEERLALDAVLNAGEGDPIRPGPLSASAVEALASERLGTAPADGFADALVRATGGLPLLVDESIAELGRRGAPPDERSVAALGTTGVERVTARVAASLDALPEGARHSRRPWRFSAMAAILPSPPSSPESTTPPPSGPPRR